VEIIDKLYQAVVHTSNWEWIAVITSILYVILMAYHQISAWYFAAISSAIYIYICFEAHLFLDASLQFFYVLMAFYGWFSWREQTQEVKLNRIQTKTMLFIIGFGILTSVITGWIFSKYTSQVSPYLDAGIFVFSILATFMASKSSVQNWLFWIVIDLFAVYIFESRALYLTALLYLIYALMAVFGYLKWKRQFNEQAHD
jgi:nicotinamide mononucleotide transporter